MILKMLKCGIEIHQRLATKKLFCECYFDASKNEGFHVDSVLERRLFAVGGETGLVDAASAFESGKKKTIEYLADSRSSCLVETDEEPPHTINEDALQTALTIALALNCKVVDEVQVMRKNITDGSSVSGFQRTALVATDGFIETSKGKVGIQSVAVEEESAGIVEKSATKDVYRLDRIGVPLIEIATAPDIQGGEHAKETAEKLGMLLRASGKAQRGIGSIRQDLNISINGGERVELKGVQELKLLPKIIDNEVERQKKVGVRNGGEVRRIAGEDSEFMRPLPGAARMYPETDVKPVAISSEMLAGVGGITSVDDTAASLTLLGLSKQMAVNLAKSAELALFGAVTKFVDASTAAWALLEVKPMLRREGVELSEAQWHDLLDSFAKGVFVRAALPDVARGMKAGKSALAVAKEKSLEKFGEKKNEGTRRVRKDFC
ncbi:MAG: hypothetical protein V1811_00305 [Candidatus Micrarchaeota archaeon]